MSTPQTAPPRCRPQGVAALVFWRRWRHLVVWLGAGLLVANIGASITTTIARPRPWGVEILGPWKGFGMPSLPLAVLAAFLVSTSYSSVPAGRLRTVGKIIVAAILGAVMASRIYLAQDAPSPEAPRPYESSHTGSGHLCSVQVVRVDPPAFRPLVQAGPDAALWPP